MGEEGEEDEDVVVLGASDRTSATVWTHKPATAGQEETPPQGEDEELLRQWSVCLLELALIRSKKRQAVDSEDFGLASKCRLMEDATNERLKAAQAECMGSATASSSSASSSDRNAKLAELTDRKQRAVEEEDYDLAEELKQQMAELQAAAVSEAHALEKELAAIRERKLKAVAEEQFELAANLKGEEEALAARIPTSSARQQPTERRALEAAEALLTAIGPEAVLVACDPEIAEAVGSDVGAKLWEDVAEDLRGQLP